MTRKLHSRDHKVAWDHGTHPNFYDYYAQESESESTLARFRRIQAAVLRVADQTGLRGTPVADIGSGAGTQARMWAELGHEVFWLDVNEPLIELAKKRARASNLPVSFEVGTATALPWADESMHVRLLPERLEHVPALRGGPSSGFWVRSRLPAPISSR